MLRARVNQLSDDIRSVTNDVDVALDDTDEARQISAWHQVEGLAKRYRELLATLAPADAAEVERGVGRRLIDLRRSADGLSKRQSGRAAEVARDAGAVPFLEQRAPPRSITFERAAPRGGKLSVGAEVESWCGKCKEMTTHNIVAMVADQPKQVICHVCNSRHDYRTEPPARHRAAARAPAGTSPTAVAPRSGGSEDRELQKRQEMKRALQKELTEAAEPKPFDPRGRYKAGDIIVHAEHGRGKIENVLRNSLLVRFLDGLRPLDLA